MNLITRSSLCRTLPLSALLLAGCARTPAQPAPAAPVAEKPKVESELARTTLSAKAYQSLGIGTQPARNEPVQEYARMTGWVMVRQGNEVTITAPVAGFVRPMSGQGVPVAGLPVRRDQELLAVEPVLSPVEQIQMASLKRGVENELAKAKANLAVAESELQRVTDLHKQGLRGQQELDQTKARLDNARADQDAAVDKLKLFGDTCKGETSLRALPVRAPRAGIVLAVSASPGQFVPAAAPLVTVADLSQLWLRVPVPEHDLPRLDRAQPASLLLPGGQPLPLKPMAFVPQVDLLRHTADMIYELPADTRPFAKDQMLSVLIPLGGKHDECIVPYAAVVFDAYGGSWVYVERTEAGAKTHVFERRRVELGPAVETCVVVHPACKPGEAVVAAGAASLFSREFHKPPAAGAAAKDLDDD